MKREASENKLYLVRMETNDMRTDGTDNDNLIIN